MNNFKIYPFKKNKYFYGKLLTVRDFDLEQKYIDEKRYMINRIMFGSGIAAGLRVSSVDEQTIVIEPGLAVDNQGREIVVPSHITNKLSLIEGFKNDSDSKNLYLCLKYNEDGKERVRSVTGVSYEMDELKEYNRIQEGYKLVLKESIEKSYVNKSIDINWKNVIIYEDEDVLIRKKYPAFVNQKEVFEVILDLQKKTLDSNVEFDYILKSDDLYGLNNEESDYIKVSFKEPLHNKEMSYQTKFLVVAKDKICDNAVMSVNVEDFTLKVNEYEKKLKDKIKFAFSIVEGNKKESLLEAFNETTMDERIYADSFDYIYLAKIQIIKVESSYIINKIIPVPFEQYIYNNNQLKNLALVSNNSLSFDIDTEVKTEIIDSNLNPRIDVKYDHIKNKFKFDFKLPSNKLDSEDIATGTLDVDIEDSFLFGKNFISEEIQHGLGVGPVCVQVGIEEIDDMAYKKEKRIYYGDSQVFYKSNFEAEQNIYSVGTLVYSDKGTFRIGLKLQSGKKNTTVKLRWWAYKSLA